ncbi:hypothetical protein [Sorangium sp. So ce341]|uniref:hypothetical protein n=1 Tax=Sorangium sp. So ce341 TaxID=3133302 RepID=UPI003F649018
MPKRVWYGWQHLLVLGGTAILAPIAAASENEALAWLSAGAVALGGPVTHWANGNLGKGFASLGLNAGCTLGGGMVGVLIGKTSGPRGGDELAGLLGASAGLLTANIIDIAVLEHEEPSTVESYEYIRLRPPRLRLAPHVALAPTAPRSASAAPSEGQRRRGRAGEVPRRREGARRARPGAALRPGSVAAGV